MGKTGTFCAGVRSSPSTEPGYKPAPLEPINFLRISGFIACAIGCERDHVFRFAQERGQLVLGLRQEHFF
jgi:hypothetical protein